jgi:hypothetical protein
MDFWSKGLGKRTVCVDLANSEATKSGEALYLRGTMEQPITWDYIMLLRSQDIVEFMGMLRDPRVADYIWDSPRRGWIYKKLLLGGLGLIWLLLLTLVRSVFRRTQVEEPQIQLPPPIERKRPTTARKRRTRRRLTATEARLSVTGERSGPRSASASSVSASDTA